MQMGTAQSRAFFIGKRMTERLKTLISKAVGPAPWYWESFPSVRDDWGTDFVWQHHGTTGELAFLVTLHLQGEAQPLLALNTYCRVFAIGEKLLGVWCPEGRDLRFVCFHPESLTTFDFTEIVGWFKNSNERMYAATPPVSEFSISSQLAEGMHPVEIPPEFRQIEELLCVANAPLSEAEDAPLYNINVLYPHAGLVEVLPQHWFTAEKNHAGRAWIARLARDAETHRIVGDGVQIEAFELEDDGKRLRRWL